MLRILQSDYDAMRRQAEESYPHECCGIMIGAGDNGAPRAVSLLVPCANSCSDTPATRYQISPEQVVAALHQARARGETILGFYHSHPDHPAVYSATDLEEAFWFGCSYVITAVGRGRAGQTQSFVLVGSEEQKGFQAEKIEII